MRDEGQRSVLVTGAAGRIGSYFAEHGHAKYRLRLTDRDFRGKGGAFQQYGEVLEGELSDLEFLKKACEGIDTVLHLAGNPDPSAVWRELLDANVAGAYHAFVAARAAGCRRIVFASSIHAVSGYPASVQVKTTEPVNPGDLYGVTKCFGESLGRYLAEQEGVSFIALRIGAVHAAERMRDTEALPFMDTLISYRDLDQLIHRCIDAEDVRFAIVHALSGNQFNRLDISESRERLGYAPQDDFFASCPGLGELRLAQRLRAGNQSDADQKSGIREELGRLKAAD
jgi:nucleoside-diphosphate-sugar epimerase